MDRTSQLTAFLLTLSIPLSGGCGSPATTPSSYVASESASEIGGSIIGGAVDFSSSLDGSNAASERVASPGPTSKEICSSLASASCSGNTIQLTDGGCTRSDDSDEVRTGIVQYLFTSGQCTPTPRGQAVTFIRSFPSGMVQTNSEQRTITSDTNTPSGWQTSIPGGGTQFVYDPVANTRSIQILGVHMVATQMTEIGNDFKVRTIWDRTISSGTPLVYDQGQRQILSGSLSVQHNYSKYTAVVSITTPLQFQLGVCNPVSGVITSTWRGSQSGTETLTYLGNDQASLLDSQGNLTTITLSHCF